MTKVNDSTANKVVEAVLENTPTKAVAEFASGIISSNDEKSSETLNIVTRLLKENKNLSVELAEAYEREKVLASGKTLILQSSYTGTQYLDVDSMQVKALLEEGVKEKLKEHESNTRNLKSDLSTLQAETRSLKDLHKIEVDDLKTKYLQKLEAVEREHKLELNKKALEYNDKLNTSRLQLSTALSDIKHLFTYLGSTSMFNLIGIKRKIKTVLKSLREDYTSPSYAWVF